MVELTYDERCLI